MDRYSRFKDFLGFNQASLGLLAELEQMHFSGRPFTSGQVREKAQALLTAVGAAADIPGLVGEKFADLEGVFDRIRGEVEKPLGSPRAPSAGRFRPRPGGDRRRENPAWWGRKPATWA